jgi:hypothetical protein
VRGESVEGVDTQLLFHDEVFSTQNWLVRIYKRKKLNRGLAQLQAGFARKKSTNARDRGGEGRKTGRGSWGKGQK